MELLKQLFRDHYGVGCDVCVALNGGGGSSRRYFRLVADGRSAIGTINDNIRENQAFFAYTRHLRAKGIRVPELFAVAPDASHYLQQDLGDRTLYGMLFDKRRSGAGFDAGMVALYRRALTDLDAIQKAGADMDFAVAFPCADFGRRAMLWDLDYFKYSFLKTSHVPFDEQRLEDDFEALVDFLLQADCGYFMYRDFQGRNIMVDEGGEMYYIDYQGGRRGAAQYDVASLLYSAKSDLPEAVRQDLLRHYVALHGDRRFMEHFWGYVLIRIMQTLGAYGYRGLCERKPYFLESIPLAVANLRAVAESHPLPVHLPELERVWQRVAALTVPADPLPTDRLTVEVCSFSYKKGLPDAHGGNGGGFVFDCRALPNPGRYDCYKPYTGKDRTVREFLDGETAVSAFLSNVENIVGQSVDKYLERHFTHLGVAFGCTGGQHRSVYCAERLAAWIGTRYPQVNVVLYHREQD